MQTEEGSPVSAEHELYEANLRLNRAEYAMRRLHLTSMPLYLSVVLGTACNLDCPFCYQTASDQRLLTLDPLGVALRRELSAFYPYLSTLRIGGGEVFIIRGFKELVDEVCAVVNRPIISISTNGTLIDEEWAGKIVGIPFQEVTFSIDGAKPDTYARLRRGAMLNDVLANVDRIQSLKARNKIKWPFVNFFFVVMRSNYREIPDFLKLAKDHGIDQVSFHILQVDQRNLSREPGVAAEIDFTEEEIRELHDLTHRLIVERRKEFKTINLIGMHSLFQAHNLETGFLEEDRYALYPADGQESQEVADSAPDGAEDIKSPGSCEAAVCNEIRLCPNAWSLMYVTETGNVHICSAASPIGNLYETPLIRLWNSPMAMAARSEIINGNYKSAGCDRSLCSWREGKKSDQPESAAIRDLINGFRRLAERYRKAPDPLPELPGDGPTLESVRHVLAERNRRIAGLEAMYDSLCEKNRVMLEDADKQNQQLAARISELELGRHYTAEDEVKLATNVRFGHSQFTKFLKKAVIGIAIRSIQLLEKISNRLKKLVNWVSTMK